MANPGSLKPFQKGHDPRRNLKGRISKPLTEESELKKYLIDYIHKPVTVDGVRTSRAMLIAERIVDDAVRGKISAIKILMDRTEGKVKTQAQMGIRTQRESDPRGTISEKELERLKKIFPDLPKEESSK